MVNDDGARRPGQEGKDACIINTARGGIISERDLVEALKSRSIGGAVLDVFEEEPTKNSDLFKLDNIVLSPHVGASTVEAQARAGMTVAEDVMRILKGERPEFPVNRELYK